MKINNKNKKYKVNKITLIPEDLNRISAKILISKDTNNVLLKCHLTSSCCFSKFINSLFKIFEWISYRLFRMEFSIRQNVSKIIKYLGKSEELWFLLSSRYIRSRGESPEFDPSFPSLGATYQMGNHRIGVCTNNYILNWVYVQ